MSEDGKTIDEVLSDLGVATVGSIDPKLIEKVESQIRLPNVQLRSYGHTQLRWNSDCDAVVVDFETRLKSTITILQEKPCRNHRLVYFHEHAQASDIFRPEHGMGKHTVVIIVKEGPGFPLICPGSHKSNEDDLGSLPPPSTISLDEGSVTVFHANIARKDPAVEGVGGAGIFLIY